MAGPTIEIDPPVRADREGGISDLATFRANSRLGASQGLVFQSSGCDFPQESQHLCYAGEVDPADKTFGGIGLIDAIGPAFPLYAGVSCFAGPDPDELERAERALAEGRDRLLEEALFDWASGGTALDGGAEVLESVANVEQAMDSEYLGQGVILMSRGDALLVPRLKLRDGRLVTLNGTPILASGRIGRGVVAGVGSIAVEHGGAVSADVVNPQTNTHWAIAEEVFAIAVDCGYRVVSTVTP